MTQASGYPDAAVRRMANGGAGIIIASRDAPEQRDGTGGRPEFSGGGAKIMVSRGRSEQRHQERYQDERTRQGRYTQTAHQEQRYQGQKDIRPGRMSQGYP